MHTYQRSGGELIGIDPKNEKLNKIIDEYGEAVGTLVVEKKKEIEALNPSGYVCMYVHRQVPSFSPSFIYGRIY